MDFSLINLEIMTAVLGLGVLVLGLTLPDKLNKLISSVAFWGILLILVYSIVILPGQTEVFNGIYHIDLYGRFFKILFLAAAVLVMMMSRRYTEKIPRQSEFYGLVILAAVGMMLMASAAEFITLYIGLELMTISFYILTAYLLKDKLSGEAGLKYLILGALSSAILLFGVSLIYAMSGTVSFTGIGMALGNQPAITAGLVIILAGFAFKISVVPFHMWTPDVYQGAPVPITAYLSVASKAAGIAALIRFLLTAVGPGELALDLNLLLAIMAGLTILVGNLIALVQKDVKRLLAYSSIAQAGYLMVGLTAANDYGLKGVLFYAMVYVFANVGAFAVTTAVETNTGGSDLESFGGLSKRSPMMAAIMTICMLSLAGIPPMAGFAGKFYLFAGAIQSGYLWLAIIGLVMSMVSVYYYLTVAKVMYIGTSSCDTPLLVSRGAATALWICVLATVLIGCYPGPLAEFAGLAIKSIM